VRGSGCTKSDCIKAIIAINQIRKKINNEKAEDISKRMLFAGCRALPTWNGYIGNLWKYNPGPF
jgi:hypothetical protein